MVAGVLQVICFLWLRTTMNRQYYHGGSLTETLCDLWAEGGIRRFYEGVSFALLQVPLSRFGDTFVQSAVVAVFGAPGQRLHGYTAGLIVATCGAFWRLCVAPLDTLKVTAQVHGEAAGKVLARRMRESGLLELWSGASAMFLISWATCYPWWAVYNTIFEYWPHPSNQTWHIVRNIVAGVLASLCSDLISNSLRVLKVKRAAREGGSSGVAGYFTDASEIMSKDGPDSLFLRGLKTRLLAGALQGAFFSVLWNQLLGRSIVA